MAANRDDGSLFLLGLKLLEGDAARPTRPGAMGNAVVFGWAFVELVAAVTTEGGKGMVAGKLLMSLDEVGNLVALDGDG